MNAFGLRSVTSSALSLWLGVFACLLGCARPTSAAAQRRTPVVGQMSCPETDQAAEDSCCQHGHNPASSEKNRHHAMSCCPTETALIQKQSIAPPALSQFFVAVLTLLNVDSSRAVSTNPPAGDSVPWQSCRDILRRVRVLRI
jgi:hypothetical protein